MEQYWWNSSGGTVMVEQKCGTVIVEQYWWNSYGGTVLVEQ